ncbi:hypothetical protein [Marinobacter gelidimuriae]|uniref:hypothetical protein n=1 Tax=Marinobacter gelidimuriae TaxID=2739064 RepID=UPI000382DF67|nr:hypothetical protein [Marinobacter gelidimuriae]
MTKILDSVTMAQPIQHTDTDTDKSKSEGRLPGIAEVQQAVYEFLRQQPEVLEVQVTKLVQVDAEVGLWEAEADVYLPNEAIRALALPVQKEVFDCKAYLVRVDRDLNIVAYSLRDLVADRTVE